MYDVIPSLQQESPFGNISDTRRSLSSKSSTADTIEDINVSQFNAERLGASKPPQLQDPIQISDAEDVEYGASTSAENRAIDGMETNVDDEDAEVEAYDATTDRETPLHFTEDDSNEPGEGVNLLQFE